MQNLHIWSQYSRWTHLDYGKAWNSVGGGCAAPTAGSLPLTSTTLLPLPLTSRVAALLAAVTDRHVRPLHAMDTVVVVRHTRPHTAALGSLVAQALPVGLVVVVGQPGGRVRPRVAAKDGVPRHDTRNRYGRRRRKRRRQWPESQSCSRRRLRRAGTKRQVHSDVVACRHAPDARTCHKGTSDWRQGATQRRPRHRSPRSWWSGPTDRRRYKDRRPGGSGRRSPNLNSSFGSNSPNSSSAVWRRRQLLARRCQVST